MGEVIEIENCLSAQGMRRVHLMSNRELTAAELTGYLPANNAQVEISQEIGVWHLHAEWHYCGPLDVVFEVAPQPRKLALKALQKGDRISHAIICAAREFLRLYGRAPQYGYMRKLPSGVEEGRVIAFMGQEVILLEADWMLERCVAVGG